MFAGLRPGRSSADGGACAARRPSLPSRVREHLGFNIAPLLEELRQLRLQASDTPPLLALPAAELVLRLYCTLALVCERVLDLPDALIERIQAREQVADAGLYLPQLSKNFHKALFEGVPKLGPTPLQRLNSSRAK